MATTLSLLIPLFLSLPLRTSADTVNGMDMSMDDGMTLANGTMMTTLHFTPFTDTIWFAGWVPQTRGALFGASLGLFMLAIVERWVAAVRAMCEVSWRREGLAKRKSIEEGRARDGKGRSLISRLRAPAFVPAHDILRGAMHAVQALLGYSFMLAVMTFQASFLIAIVLGLGVGEALFGRYAVAGYGAH